MIKFSIISELFMVLTLIWFGCLIVNRDKLNNK
jgi:hypothetical protein